MRKLLEAFTIAQIQTSLTILDWITQNDKTVEDVREYLAQGIKRTSKYRPVRRSEKIRVPKKPCPECGTIMRPFQVNHTKCTQVGGDYNIQYVCTNSECDYDELVKI